MLVTKSLDPQLVRLGLGSRVDYEPGPLTPGTIEGTRSNAWIVGTPPDEPLLERWAARVRELGHRPVLVAAEDRPELAGACTRLGIERCGPLDPLDPTGTRPLDLALLAMAERAELRPEVEARWQQLGIGTSGAAWPQARSVTLIGAGVVNLLCAHALVEAGFEVELVDAGADPRQASDWRGLGATAGGENARTFCFTEADNYNEKGDGIHADMLSAFEHRIEQGGWLVDCAGSRSPGFREWLRRFTAVPAWQARLFADDIHGFNRASAPRWARMRERFPELFEGVGLVDGVLLLYSDAEDFDAAQQKQRRVGALQRALSPTQAARQHPGLAAACERGAIAGALEVVGFTLNIHDFVARLLGWLEQHGVRMTWGKRARWQRANDVVDGLRLDDGTLHRAHHYVASPGAYGPELLAGTRCEGLLAGIAGLWMTLPNLEPPLRCSLKIHREGHCGEDSNVTLAHDDEGREILILGSGYAVVGDQPGPLDLDGADARSLYLALEDTIRRFFPRQHALGRGHGWSISPRACVRPFTPTGLGFFDGLPAREGLALLVGGHNTGGFTQAPAIAASVVETLLGHRCPMQLEYSPDRGRP